uniref:RRM domain-containing protein n=1 Tax=Moniliophthora roreri TaxID=221103 RepID=A0A0W0F8T2_MONRR
MVNQRPPADSFSVYDTCDASTPPERELDDVQERQIYSCAVTFGYGASVVHVSAALESYRVLVSFAGQITEGELGELGRLYGDLTSRVTLRYSAPGSFTTAVLEFATPAQAEEASRGIHGTAINETRLNATLDLRSSVADSGSAGILRNSKVKVSWFTPTTTAFLHYHDKLEAMTHATQLDGWIVGGRKVKASFQKPTINQRRSFTVIVNGLPAHNLNWKNYLLKHSKATSIDITKPVPLLHEDACHRAKTILERHGIVESFDVLALDPSKSKTVAFAHFSTAEAASAAVAFLNGKKCTELENSPLWIELVFSVKYSVPVLRFSCIRAELDTLRDAHTDAKMGYYDKNEHGAPVPNVVLRVYGTDAKAVARLKLSVERVLAGETVQVDGSCVWDDIFLKKEGTDFLRGLGEVKHASCYVQVHADTRTRCLRLYGDTELKAVTRKLVLEYLEQQRAKPQIITLSPDTFHQLLKGRISQLDRIASGVVLDIVKQELRVQDLQRKATVLLPPRRFVQSVFATRQKPGKKSSPCVASTYIAETVFKVSASHDALAALSLL